MNVLRTSAIVLSTLLHGAVALAFVDFKGGRSLEAGEGTDQLRVEQGIAIEGLSRLGDALETIEARDPETIAASEAVAALQEVKAAEVPPEQPSPPEVPVTEQAPELKDVVTSPLGPAQEIVAATEPPPEVEKPQPAQVAREEQVEQVAVIEQQAAAKGQTGGDASAYMAYLGSLRTHVERFKVRPRNVKRGTVVVSFSIDREGAVLDRTGKTSSGYKELDLAALSAIDKAAPFPKFPDAMTRERIDLTIPFQFVTR
mgnify:CR=1 FL=1